MSRQPISRALTRSLSLGAGAVTFVVFFAGTIALAHFVGSREPALAPALAVGAGMAIVVWAFVASILALGTATGREIPIAWIRGAMTMGLAAASASLLVRGTFDLASWSRFADRGVTHFAQALLSLAPFAVIAVTRARRMPRS